MRIALVMTSAGAGGVEQSVVPYLTALLEQGHTVAVAMDRRSTFLGDVRSLGVKPKLIHWPMRPRLLRWIRVYELRRHLRAFGPDAVIGFSSKGYPHARKAMGRRVPVLTRIAEMAPARIRALAGADILLVTSEEMRDLALTLGVAPEKVEVVTNFIVGAPQPRPARRDPVRIGTLGRMVPAKGFDVLIEAAAQLRATGETFELVIGGNGPEADTLKAQARAAGLDVRFPGWIDNSAKAAFFRELDIFVCPSRDEPFGFVYLEAMQAGVPIVTTETVGARWILRDGVDGLICPVEPEQLARQIARLIAAPELGDRLVDAAQATLRSRFSTHVAGPVLSRVLAKSVASHAATGWRG